MHLYPFLDSYCMFFIYAITGWVLEVVYYGYDEGRFINRGFLNGPLCPVYGIGFYGVVILLRPLAYNFFLLFFGSAFICTFVEFWAGFILYKIFEMRWWDYRNEKYNFMGFICPKFSMYWGIACSFGIYVLHPTVLWALHHTYDTAKIVILSILTAALICDLIATVTTIFGVKKRLGILSGISGEMKVISDKVGGSIYGRVDAVMTKSEPARKKYSAWRELRIINRKEEKDLIRRHRAEEKALFSSLMPRIHPSQIKPKEAIASRVSAVVKTFKAPELRVLRNVYLNVGETGKSAFDNIVKMIPFPKKPADDTSVAEDKEDLSDSVAVIVDPADPSGSAIVSTDHEMDPVSAGNAKK